MRIFFVQMLIHSPPHEEEEEEVQVKTEFKRPGSDPEPKAKRSWKCPQKPK